MCVLLLQVTGNFLQDSRTEPCFEIKKNKGSKSSLKSALKITTTTTKNGAKFVLAVNDAHKLVTFINQLLSNNDLTIIYKLKEQGPMFRKYAVMIHVFPK